MVHIHLFQHFESVSYDDNRYVDGDPINYSYEYACDAADDELIVLFVADDNAVPMILC